MGFWVERGLATHSFAMLRLTPSQLATAWKYGLNSERSGFAVRKIFKEAEVAPQLYFPNLKRGLNSLLALLLLLSICLTSAAQTSRVSSPAAS